MLSIAGRSSTPNRGGAHLLVFVINQRKLRPLTFILAVGILVGPELKFQPGLSCIKVPVPYDPRVLFTIELFDDFRQP